MTGLYHIKQWSGVDGDKKKITRAELDEYVNEYIQKTKMQS